MKTPASVIESIYRYIFIIPALVFLLTFYLTCFTRRHCDFCFRFFFLLITVTASETTSHSRSLLKSEGRMCVHMDASGCLQLPSAAGVCLAGHMMFTVSATVSIAISFLTFYWLLLFLITAGGCLRNPVGDKRLEGYTECITSDTLTSSNGT